MSKFEAVKLKLESRLKELNERAEEIEKDLSEPGDDDWSESATESEGDEVSEKMGNLAEAEMGQIDRALTRIDNGTYGICTSCQASIPPARLEAVPYAALCMDCSQDRP
jgi:RNA polymerase-binding transcription factor DksA